MFDNRVVTLALGIGGLVVALFVVPLLVLRGPAISDVAAPAGGMAAGFREQARLSAALAMAASYQRAISDYYYARGEMPFDYQDLNLADYAPYRDDALRAVAIEPEGVLRLSLRLGNGARGELRLIPVYQPPSAALRWRCRAQGLSLIRTLLPECKILDR